MSGATVIWLSSGGIPEFVASPGINAVVIDFMDLEAGGDPPALTEEQRALLSSAAPDVLFDLERYRQTKQLVACVEPVMDVAAEQNAWVIPAADLERHCLSGPFFVQSKARQLVERLGLDQVLRWFNTTRGILVGETQPIGDTGLEAYFGFDDRKPDGECFFVRIGLA